MDRQVSRKMLNEVTVTTDLKRTSGQEGALDFERQTKNILKSLSEFGVVMQHTVNDMKKGTRATTFAFAGPPTVQAAVAANLAEIGKKRGVENSAITVSDISKKQYDIAQERIANARTGSEVSKNIVLGGGKVTLNKDTGITEMTIPHHLAKQVFSTIDKGEETYKAGLAGSTILQASHASEYDKAYAGYARDEEVRVAAAKAEKNFVKDNPSSKRAKDLKAQAAEAAMTPYDIAYMDIDKKEKRLRTKENAAREYALNNPDSNHAVTRDAKYRAAMRTKEVAAAKAAEAAMTPYDRQYRDLAEKQVDSVDGKRARADFIKANPNSDLAKEEADKKSQEAKKQAATNARNAKGAMLGIVATVAAVVGTSIGILTKILGGVLETARSTTKMMLDGTRYNMSSTEMNKLNAIAANMQFDTKDGNPFSAIFGNLVEKYGNVHSPSFSSNIAASAAFLQKSTPDMLALMNGKASNPQQLFDQLLADSLNVTMSKRGGVLQYGSIEQASMLNMPNVTTLLGDKGAEAYNLMMNDMIKNGTAYTDRTFTAEQAHAYYYKMGGASEDGSANVVASSTNARKSAENRTKDLTEVGQVWEGLKSEVFTKMLDYLGQILSVVRSMLRPLLRSLDPAAAAREDAKARAMNIRLEGEHNTDIRALLPASGKTSEEAERLANLAIKADSGDTGASEDLASALGGQTNADAWVDKNSALIKHFQMLNYVKGNQKNNDFSYGAEEIDVAMQMENDAITRFYQRKERLAAADKRIGEGGSIATLSALPFTFGTSGAVDLYSGSAKVRDNTNKNTDFVTTVEKMVLGSKLGDLGNDSKFIALAKSTAKLDAPKVNAALVAAGGAWYDKDDVVSGKYKGAKLSAEEVRILLTLSSISESKKNTGESAAPAWREFLKRQNPAAVKALVNKITASSTNAYNSKDLQDILLVFNGMPTDVQAQTTGRVQADAELARVQREAARLHSSTVTKDAATKQKEAAQAASGGTMDGQISFNVNIPGGQSVKGAVTPTGTTSTTTGPSNGPLVENLVTAYNPSQQFAKPK